MTTPDIPVPEIRGRPLIGRPVLGAWVAMLTAVYLGIDSYERNFDLQLWPLDVSGGPNLGANFRTYRYAAELAGAGEPFYSIPPTGLNDWAVYLYPPITTVIYYPFTLLEWRTGYWILVGLNVLAGLLAAALVVRFIEREGSRISWADAGLIGLVFLLSPFTFGTIYYGNINLILALAFVVGFLALERDWEHTAGIAFGLSALWKLFPALVGAWFIRFRAWRAVLSATLVGVGGLLLGMLVFGWDRTVAFFSDVVIDRSETAAFVGGYPADGTYYVTVQRPISQLLWTIWPGAPSALLLPLTLVVCGLVLAYFYRDVTDRMRWLMAFFATVVVTVTIAPALQWYIVLLFFPMIPLLYLWDGPGRFWFALGAFVLFFNDRPGSLHTWLDGQSLPLPIELLLRDVFTLATIQLYGMAIMLLACAWYCYRTSENGPATRQVYSDSRT